jgi:hypothetical protein
VCGWALPDRQEGECWNGLRELHPLPYHLDFMVGLASGVPPSLPLLIDGMLIISFLKVHFLINRWNPDAIVFNSWQYYGCPNYWMLHFFKDSSGAMFHPSTIQLSNYDQLVTSAITWKNPQNGNTYLKIKVLLFSH